MFLLFQKHKLSTWYSKGFETSISDEKSAYGNELSFIYTEQIGTFDPWKATFLKISTSNVFYPWGCFNVHSQFNPDIYQMCIFWIVNHHILNISYKVFFFFFNFFEIIHGVIVVNVFENMLYKNMNIFYVVNQYINFKICEDCEFQ